MLGYGWLVFLYWYSSEDVVLGYGCLVFSYWYSSEGFIERLLILECVHVRIIYLFP